MKRFFAFFALIVCTLLIQTAILSNWYALPVVPDILLLIVLYTGFYNGSIAGETAGFFSGLLLDFLSASPLGFNALLRTVIGFLSGLLHRTLETKGFVIPAVLGFASTLIKALSVLSLSFFYPGSILTYPLFSPVLWYECLFNALCAPLIFWFLSFFRVFSDDSLTEGFD